jgi:hypothetical protein
MSVTTPDWLTRRGGALVPRPDGNSWAVLLNGEPLYALVPVPIAGKHGCQVIQTNNGRRFDTGSSHATLDEALQGGLEDLRKALGW